MTAVSKLSKSSFISPRVQMNRRRNSSYRKQELLGRVFLLLLVKQVDYFWLILSELVAYLILAKSGNIDTYLEAASGQEVSGSNETFLTLVLLFYIVHSST